MKGGWLILFIGKIFVFIFFISTLILSSDDDVGVDKFLENIRRTIKEVIGKQSSILRRRQKGDEKKVKSVRRKRIIEKLATPFVLQPKHRIIEYEKGALSAGKESKNEGRWGNGIEGKGNIPSSSIISTVNRVWRENPALMLSGLPDIRKIISQRGAFTGKWDRWNGGVSENRQVNPDHYNYVMGLRDWYVELAKRALILWSIVEEIFINNPDGFEYFSQAVCPGLNKSHFFLSSACYDVYSDSMLPGNFLKQGLYLTSSGAFAPYCFRFYKEYFKIEEMTTFLNLWENEKVSSGSDLCRDFLVLFSLGDKITWYELKLRGCEKNLTEKVCSVTNLNNNARMMNLLAKRWFKMFKYVFIKIAPFITKLITKPNFPKNENNEVNIETILSLLLYKNGIESKVRIVEEIYSKLRGLELNELVSKILRLNTCNFNLDKEKSNLIKTIFTAFGNSNLKSEEISSLINELEQSNAFVSVFDKLSSDAPNVLMEVMKSESFKSFVSQFDVLKEKARKDKDVCSFLLLALLLGNEACLGKCANIDDEVGRSKCRWECENKGREKNVDITDLLFTENREAIVFALKPDLIPPPKSANTNDIFDQLNKMAIFDYYIYKTLSLQKIATCGYGNIKLGEKDYEETLKQYKCIFDNKDLDVKCYFVDNVIMLAIIDYLGGNLELPRIRTKLRKLEGKVIIDVVENALRTYLFKSDGDLFNCYKNYRKGYVDEQSVRYFCGSVNRIQYLKRFCLAPLRKCEEVNAPDITPECKKMDEICDMYNGDACEGGAIVSEYCKDLEKQCNDATAQCERSMASYKSQLCYFFDSNAKKFVLDRNSSCKLDSDCTLLHSTLSSLWDRGEFGSDGSGEIKKEMFCEHTTKVIEGCCNGISRWAGSASDSKVTEFFGLFDNKQFYIPFKGVNDGINDLKLRVGEYFFNLLERKVENLSTIISAFSEGRLCN